jgi:hypothetical protein
MTQYANLNDFDDIAEFDRRIASEKLRRAIEEHRVMIFKTAGIVMGVARFNY